MTEKLFDRYQELLERAVAATRNRTFFSAYPEVPSGKFYGESAKKDGLAAYQARLNKPFDIDQPGTTGRVGGETSPYGLQLGISYPKADLDALVPAAAEAVGAWRDTTVETRVGVCLEILDRINKHSFEIANAVMHTTGQGFMMAFQAGGPHAQDRGLEAVALAYDEMTRYPKTATWKKQVGRDQFVTLEKTFHIIGRGVAAVVACSTFPTWNGYPGLFASLATGNAVIVKPHPGAILPLAVSVEIARTVLAENKFNANLVTLVADERNVPVTESLVTRPEIAIIDYTGSSTFGTWIEQHARQADVYTEKAGVNSLVLDSAPELKPITSNIAFSLCLYSGQMCTTPQNIFIPSGGIQVGDELIAFNDVAKAIVKAIDWLLGDPNRATEILGAIQNVNTMARIEAAVAEGGEIVRDGSLIENEQFPGARVRSPVVLKVNAAQKLLYMREVFGPLVYLVETENTNHSLALAAEAAQTCGAISGGVYSTRPEVIEHARRILTPVGVPVSFNLTGQIFVNQSAAFSDFHVAGNNPAGNATLCDSAFVSRRFRPVQTRMPVEV